MFNKLSCLFLLLERTHFYFYIFKEYKACSWTIDEKFIFHTKLVGGNAEIYFLLQALFTAVLRLFSLLVCLLHPKSHSSVINNISNLLTTICYHFWGDVRLLGLGGWMGGGLLGMFCMLIDSPVQ